MKIIELTGQQFGKLTVTGPSDVRRHSGKWWHCTCECGKPCLVYSNSLRRGVTKSCGCLRGKPQRLRPYEALYKKMARDAMRFRNISVELTYEEFLEFTSNDQCFYCLSPILWKDFSSSALGYNLDRKDSEQGYRKDNIVVCCKRCNMGKRDTFTFPEWYGMTEFLRKK